MNIASLDIGTNTALLLIANINNNGINSKNKNTSACVIKPLINELRMPRLGKGLSKGGEISESSIILLNEALTEYSRIIESHDCETVLAAGTNALRIASNSDEVIQNVKDKFGIDIKVIPGKEEARLTFLGARSSAASDNVILIDIGGGSTEITIGSSDKIIYSHSFQAGAVTLSEKYMKHGIASDSELSDMSCDIRDIFAPLEAELSSGEIPSETVSAAEAVAVAGTPVSIASIRLGLMDYDEEKIEGYRLAYGDVTDISKTLAASAPEDILQRYGSVLKGREDIITAGSVILKTILELLNKNSVTVSTRGLRYGIIIDYLDNHTNCAT